MVAAVPALDVEVLSWPAAEFEVLGVSREAFREGCPSVWPCDEGHDVSPTVATPKFAAGSPNTRGALGVVLGGTIWAA
jgi:hypothetical protein